jgi:hypothetical protein
MLKFGNEREVARVVLIGPIQRDDANTIGDVEQHCGETF